MFGHIKTRQSCASFRGGGSLFRSKLTRSLLPVHAYTIVDASYELPLPTPDTLRSLLSRRRPTPAPASARRPGPPAPSPASGSPSSTYPSGMRGRAGSLASSAFSLSSREDRSRVLEMCSLRRTRSVGYYGCLRADMSVRCRPCPRPSGSATAYAASLLFAYLLQAIHNDAYWEQLGYMPHPHKPPPLPQCFVAHDRVSRRTQIHDTKDNLQQDTRNLEQQQQRGRASPV